jgi:hypothetical protein
MTENNELGRVWKEAVMTNSLVLYWYLPGEHEENHENFQSL